MTVAIIDRLKVIKISQHHGKYQAFLPGNNRGLLENAIEVTAIKQIPQRIA